MLTPRSSKHTRPRKVATFMRRLRTSLVHLVRCDVRLAKASNGKLYTKLDPTKRQIRLLKLAEQDHHQSGEYDLECTLTTASLDDPLTYDALSYAWGDPSVRVPILIDGQVFLVTLNLHEALKGLRDKGAFSDYLWADAICINQSDLAERGQQVGMMGDVYRRASTVHVWLGVELPLVQHTFEYLERALEHADDFGHFAGEGHDHGIAVDEEALICLNELFSLSWFQRLWVMQEVVVAKRRLMHCGKASTRLECFDYGIAYLSVAVNAEIEALALSKRPTNMHYDAFSRNYWKTGQLSPSISDWSARTWSPLPLDDIADAFVAGSKRLAADSRDHVYALLGFLPPAIGIIPDYTLSTEVVFRTSTLQMLKWTDSLHWLIYSSPQPGRSLPSWVLDFRRLNRPDEALRNTASNVPCLIEEQSPGQLRVHAIFIDGIKDLARGSDGIKDEVQIREALIRWQTVATSPRSQEVDTNSLESETRDCFWRSVTMNYLIHPITKHVTAGDSSEVGATELQMWLADKNYLPAERLRALWRLNVFSKVWVYTFFTTAMGRCGLATVDLMVEEGDKIAVLAGLNTPVILRPLPDRDQDKYELLGACYCDGVMNREAIPTVDVPTTGTALDYGFEEIVLV
ncbi:hypothetical protein LTR37_018201 [Vermiconidia calcicola]|uniref:Uncharacterized protein n=1 Tax=Vermiconidia calcicola TaxID=1690605 RepID=A0ACC3MHR3_9PEZI|nr:hypothetical protein LTR37_018201 [Vermiconidia calcicola]